MGRRSTTGIVSIVSSKINSTCHTRRCARDGCSVSLANIPRPRAVINMDCDALPETTDRMKHCDYLVAYERDKRSFLVLLELKGGRPDVNQAVQQIQQSADWIVGLLPRKPSYGFTPVLAHKGIRSHEKQNLKRAKIVFRGQPYKLITVHCGGKLKKGA